MNEEISIYRCFTVQVAYNVSPIRKLEQAAPLHTTGHFHSPKDSRPESPARGLPASVTPKAVPCSVAAAAAGIVGCTGAGDPALLPPNPPGVEAPKLPAAPPGPRDPAAVVMELEPDAPKPERTASSGFMVPLRSGQSLAVRLWLACFSG